MTTGSWARRTLLMAAITLGGVLLGKEIVPLRAGGNPVVVGFLATHSSYAFPSWLWPTLMIAVLVVLWLVFLSAVIVRTARLAAQSASGRKRGQSEAVQMIEHDQTAEGWYEDPYQLHQDRWISMGTSTALVRDLGVEANDPPPVTPPSSPLVPTVDQPQLAPNGEDLRRVGETGSGAYDPQVAGDAALDANTWFPLD